MPITTTTLQVTFVSESAAYDNTFGWYNSQTGMGGILFADVEQQGPHAPLNPGATVSFTVNTADLPYIQFFLIPDGADHNDSGDLTGAIKVIQLSNGTWAVADVDANGNIIYVHGRPDVLNGTGANALFTETSKNAGGIDYASSTVGPNQNAGTLGGDTANGPTGQIAWEDTAARRLYAHVYGQPGDADYNDAVFNIVALNHPPETNAASASGNEDSTIAITLSGTDDDGTVASFRVTTLPANGTLYRDAALTQVIAAGSTVTASGNAATVYFKPNANFNGGASFQYAAIDDDGAQDASAATASITVGPVNDAPSGADRTIALNEDASYTFTTADFGFTDPSDTPANALLAVTITTLPAAGSLTLNGVAVTAGQSVSAADIAAGLLIFTPAANANGAAYASFTFQVQDNGGTANGGADTDASPNTMTVSVNAVNDAPAGADATIDAGNVYVFSTADFGFTDPNDGPGNAFAAVRITTLPGSGTLTNNGNPVNAGDFISVADISAGHLQFTGSANTSFTFQVQDNGGTANGGVDLDQSPNTFTLIVNTAPVANDDSVAATEAGGVNNAVAGHDPAGNVILGTGDAGNAQDTDAQDPSAALIVVAAGTGVEGSADNGTVGTAFSGLHGSLLLGANGAYTYTLNQTDAAVQALHTAADTVTDVFHYTIQDSGGLTDTATLIITIHGANDLPLAADDAGSMTEDDGPALFMVTANDTLDPDNTAANTISVGSVTVVGPAGEVFVNGDAQATVVGNQIQVTLNNASFQQLAVGEQATVTVAYTLTGDAGDTSSANLVVTVNGANDLPVAVDDSGAMTEDQGPTAFTVLGNDTLDPDFGAPNTVTAGAVSNVSAPSGDNIDAGDVLVSVNGSNQIVVTLGADFQHLGEGESASFDVAYTLQGDQGGDAATAMLHVTVTGSNDGPVAQNLTFNGANSAIGNTALVLDNGTGAAPTDPAGPQKTVSGSLLAGASDADGPNALTVLAETKATTHGSVIINADGDFTYLPDAGYTGSDSFTYTVTDGNTPTAGTDTKTVTINVAAPKVWYVDADAAAGGDGTSDNPFNSFASLNGAGGAGDVDGAGDIIFVYGGTLSSGIELESGQQLLSKEHGLTVNGTVLEVADGSSVTTINGTVTLAGGGIANTIQGIDFGTTSGFALAGTNVGDAQVNTVTGGTIDNTAGGAISINGSGTGMNLQLESVSSSGSSTNAISFSNARGTFNADGGTLSNAGGNTVSITGDGVNDDLAFTYDGAINDDGNVLVNVTGQSGGSTTFNGALTDGAGAGGGIAVSANSGNATVSFTHSVSLNTGTSTAVSFAGNGAGTALNFDNTNAASNGLDIVTTSGTGFSATGGGTVTVLDAVGAAGNSIVAGSGTGLSITNTDIGSGHVTFETISSGGGANNGITLDNTGTAAGNGGLHVTGTGTAAGSGGTIANKTGADGSTTSGIGIYLNNTKDVQLANMQLNDFQNYGILGNNVAGMALDGIIVNGLNGNSVSGVGEGAAYFTGLTGSATVSSSIFTGGFADAFHVFNNGGQTLNRITITGSTFATNTAAGNASNDALVFQATNGTFNATVQNSSFTSARGDLFQLDIHGNVVSDLVFTGNTLTNNNPNIVSGGGGMTISSGGAGDDATLTFDISDNTMRDALGTALGISTGPGGGAFTGTIDNNTIGVAGVASSGSAQGSGIAFVTMGGDSSNVSITNNEIFQYGSVAGLLIQYGGHLSGGNAQQTFVVQGNTVNTPATAFGQNGFLLNWGTSAADAAPVSLTLGGPGALANNFLNSNGGGGAADIRLRQRFDTDVGLHAGGGQNYGGAPNDTAAVASFVSANNSGTVIVNVSGAAGSGFFGSPLLAADGGVDSAFGAPGESHLSQAQLDSVVSAALLWWAAAGVSADQLANLGTTQYVVADLAGDVLGMHGTSVVQIDADAAGRGWFVDGSPFDSNEFAYTANAAETHLFADPTQAPAGHMDLLTAVLHEMGHVLGLEHSHASPDDVMGETLVAGERRLPDAAPSMVQPVTAGQTVAGSAGADAFVFDTSVVGGAPLAHIAGYSAAQGDTLDFSALTDLPSGLAAALASGDVRVAEDAAGGFATLQVHDGAGANDWSSVAQLDGVHAGDSVNVALDAAHVLHLHAVMLV